MKKYIVWLLIFAVLEITLALYLTHWRENFWNAVSTKQSLQFLQQLGVFTVVALIICVVSGVSGYLVALTAIKWREKLNWRAMQRQLSIPYSKIENINQRVQEDCMSYPDLVLNIGFGVVKSIVYCVVFSISLLFSFSFWFLLIVAGYAIVGSIIAHYVAKPLISLNYQQQRIEATYRNQLTIENFNDCIHIMLGLAKKQKHLTYFQQFYMQLGVVIPLVIVAPMYFSSGMTLGSLMRFNSVASTILENLSFGINSFAQINKLISCRKRLKEANIL